MTNEDLIQRIDAAAAETGLSRKTICQKAVGNTRLYDSLKAGGSVTLTVAARLVDWLNANTGERAA